MDSKRSHEPVWPSSQASVIVNAYTENGGSKTHMAFDSIARQTVAPREVIVIIDHNPALCERREEEYPKIEVIPNKFERELSAGSNTRIQCSLGDIVLFLNDDAGAEPSWLENLLPPMTTSPSLVSAAWCWPPGVQR